MAEKAGLTAESWLSMWESRDMDKDSSFPSAEGHGDDHDHEHSHDHDHHHDDTECHDHGTEVDKHLIRYLSHLTCDNTDNSIFVSL